MIYISYITSSALHFDYLTSFSGKILYNKVEL